MRYSFVQALIQEAKINKNIFLLTGDLGFTVFEEFRDKFKDRFINVGVAEQNLMGIAAGLALSGKIVFTYSMASFATMRPFEQIRNNIAAHNLPVIVVGSGAGLSYADASFTHHALEDIGLMRQIPNMVVLCPSDPIEAAWATKASIKLKKPTYLRLGKKGESVINQSRSRFTIGKGNVMRKGKDIVIFATGNIVHNALKTGDLLSKKNIQSTVVSVHTIKPLDNKMIINFSKKTQYVITIEEHSIIGGLGSAVAEVIAENNIKTRFFRFGIPDRFVVGLTTQDFLRKKEGLDPDSIVKKILNLLMIK